MRCTALGHAHCFPPLFPLCCFTSNTHRRVASISSCNSEQENYFRGSMVSDFQKISIYMTTWLPLKAPEVCSRVVQLNLWGWSYPPLLHRDSDTSICHVNPSFHCSAWSSEMWFVHFSINAWRWMRLLTKAVSLGWEGTSNYHIQGCAALHERDTHR